MRPLKARAGWVYIQVRLRDNRKGALSTSPIMTAIVSGGGRGVKPWVECRLFPAVAFAAGKSIDARGLGVEEGIVEWLGQFIPPGGHLMIDYENPGQEETFDELVMRVPPAASHLGALMFRAGFRGEFKDWYFSEGGHEGPRKLQANKPPDSTAARRAMENHRCELKAFVGRPAPADPEAAAILARAQSRARALLRDYKRQS
jgi:hypothetical protein